MALNEEGVTAYMMTGAYNYDGPTITGDPGRDIMFCEKVLGVKLALSDHRSSNITYKELIALASKTRVAGMLSGKPGIVVLHMGNGHKGFSPIFKALEKSEIPISQLRPTHVGRNEGIRENAFKFLEMGGYIDFTAGTRKVGKTTEHIKEAMKRVLPLDRITVSTDGHGSWSIYNEDGTLKEMGVASVENLMRDLRHLVVEGGVTLNNALPFFTSNVASGLGLKNKGVIREQADADILILNRQLMPDTVIAKGKVMMENGELLCKGTYE
jgi:beta-aspartyl-dipeptidase (metallo-type)